MASNDEAYQVAWVVEAESGHLAREKVVGICSQLTLLPNADFRDFSLPFVEPVQVGTDEGWKVLESAWAEYLDVVAKDLELVYSMMEGELGEAMVRARDSMEFKSACYRIGAISGWPIRIYWESMGLNFPSQIQGLQEQDPGAWIVTVQIA